MGLVAANIAGNITYYKYYRQQGYYRQKKNTAREKRKTEAMEEKGGARNKRMIGERAERDNEARAA